VFVPEEFAMMFRGLGTTRQRRILIAGAVAAVAIAAGVFLFARNPTAYGEAETAGSKTAGGSAVRVRVVTPSRGGLEGTVMRPGSVHAFQYAQLFAKVAGYLHNQTVDIGYRVKKGQVLAEVDAPEIEANVQGAAADVEKGKAQMDVMAARLQSAKAQLQEAKVKVAQAEADVQNAVALLVLRREQYQRIKRLVELRSIEQELADEKMEAQKAAEANEIAMRQAVEVAKVAVTTAQAQIASASADLGDAKAQVKVTEAALARANVFAAYLKLRAPFAGVITVRNFHEGDFIRAGNDSGNQPVLVVARTDLMRVIVDVPDPDVPYTHAGARAELRIGSLSGQVFTGKVARTAWSEAYSTRTMRTEIDLPNPKESLADGMFGAATIYLGAHPNALTIPTACLSGPEKDGRRSVFVVRDGKARRLEVRVGRDDGIHAEVLSGLRPDDQVIEAHGSGLADAAAVAVAPK
jgi:HlyD family secretion protein